MNLKKNETEEIKNEKRELNDSLKSLNQIKDSFEVELKSVQENLDKENEQHSKKVKEFKVQLEK